VNVRTDWWSRRAIGLHLALTLTVPACGLACWWQTSRALSGNTLSWVYSFEWPFFAGYAVYMWWRLVHEDPSEANRALLAESATTARLSATGGALSVAGSGAGQPDEAQAAAQFGNSVAEPGAAEPVGFDPYDDEADPDMAAYNRYLAELNASGRQKRW
jgi:hypothetical protein